MKSIKCLFIIASFIPNEIFSQGKINLLGGMDLSGNYYSYARHGKVLRSTDDDDDAEINICANLNVVIQYRPIQSFSLEAGMQLVEFSNNCIDTAYLTRHPENRNAFINLSSTNNSLAPLGFDKHYTSYYITGTKYLSFGKTFSIYGSLGLSYNHLSRGSTLEGVKTIYDSKNNEILQLSYTCINSFIGFIGESGVNFTISKGRVNLYTGIRFNTSYKNVLVGNYTDTQNNTLINTDHISTKGTYLGIVTRVGINLFSGGKLNPKITKPRISLTHNRVKSDKTKYPKKIDKQDKEERIDNKELKSSSISTDSLPKKLKNREVKIKKELIVNNRVVTIRVWDYDKIDGDIISLYLNGELILGKYTLTKERYEIKIELKPGINYLVLHSISMGKDVPCTSAMIIDDGRNQQEVILYSTPQGSDGIKIKLEE
jgi:hypothetical protein